MKIYIGSDHAGYAMKEELKEFLEDLEHDVEDCGAYTFDPNDDYPDFIEKVAQQVSTEAGKGLQNKVFGIILGSSGEGEAMDANRFPHVRALEYYGGNLEIVKLGREHNDANILSLGARFVPIEEAKQAVEIFIETNFSAEIRHQRRIDKIDDENHE